MSYIMTNSTFKCSTKIKSDTAEAFQWHEREGALERLTPPWEKIKMLEKTGGIEVGARAAFSVKTGPFRVPWHAEHTEYTQNKHFKDIQTKGPFAMWEHSHDFATEGDYTVINDTINYRFPFHTLAAPFAGPFIKSKLNRMFAYRSETSRNDIEILNEYKPKTKTIVVSGATGAVGRALIPYLQTQGHRVIRLVRDEKQLCIGDVCWNPNAETMEDCFENADVVIHLAGEPIGSGKWTNEKKLSIVDSRVRSTSLLARTIANMKKPPKLLISASAIGYYGEGGEAEMDELSPNGRNFISHVCYHWEKAAKAAKDKGIRVVHMRIGVALSPLGGALERMQTPFSLGLGTVLGSGRQHLSWISMDDVLYAVTHIMETPSLSGPVNLTSPNTVRWGEFADILAHVLKRPRVLSVPEWLIRAVYGQMGREVILASAKVKPKKLLESGFSFRYPVLEDTLRHLLGRTDT